MQLAIDAVYRYCVEAFSKVGVPPDQARTLADVLLEADLRGHVDHGSSLVALYVPSVLDRSVNPAPRVRAVRETPVSALIDGDGGFGAIAATRAVAACVERARSIGFGVAAVRNTSHSFYPGYYPLQIAEAGFVGFFTTTSRPAIAPPGIAERVLGQDPLAYAIPAGSRPPILLDIGLAASVAKIRIAMEEGREIPADWVVDREGKPVTDAAAAMSGLLVPIGGHKGFGLALVMDALVGLGGAPGGPEAGAHGAVGFFLWALDPGLFGPPDQYRARVERLLDQVAAATPFPGRRPASYPGEGGARRKASAVASGRVDLPETVARAMAETARALGIDSPVSSSV